MGLVESIRKAMAMNPDGKKEIEKKYNTKEELESAIEKDENAKSLLTEIGLTTKDFIVNLFYNKK